MNTPDGTALRLIQFSHRGGCACRVAPALLRAIIAKATPGVVPEELVVGIETGEDVAAYLIVPCAPEAVDQVMTMFRAEGFEYSTRIGEFVAGPASVTVS